jgi:hypothetical protein
MALEKMLQACHAGLALAAEGLLAELAGELDKTHPAPPRRCGTAWPKP